MKLADIDFQEYKRSITTQGVNIKISSFHVSLITKIPVVIKNFYHLYHQFPLVNDNEYIDFAIELKKPSNLRYFYRPQVNFYMDGHRPFKPLPLDQAMAFFEWGLNWAIAQYSHHYLIIHSAVVEKNNKTFIFPGIPGAGKSTLCAALVHHGWRLLSDEQALISLDAQHVTPVSRPICLKNESINIIKSFCPKATFGEVFLDTNKGDICHIKPPESSIENMNKLATPHYIVFPKFSRKAITAKVTPIEKGEALIQVIDHSFNYDALAEQGFKTATQLISNCETFNFEYHHLDEALSLFDKMVEK